MSAGHSYTTMTTHLIRIIKEQLILFLLISEHNCNYCLYLLMEIEVNAARYINVNVVAVKIWLSGK